MSVVSQLRIFIFKEQGGEVTPEHLERLYVFCLMWSVGALLELEDRRKIERWLRTHEAIHLDLPSIPPGSEDTIFDYVVGIDGQYQNIPAVLII